MAFSGDTMRDSIGDSRVTTLTSIVTQNHPSGRFPAPERRSWQGGKQKLCGPGAAGPDGYRAGSVRGGIGRSSFGPAHSDLPTPRNATLRRGLTFYGSTGHNELRAKFWRLLITISVLMHFLEGTKIARFAPGSIRQDGRMVRKDWPRRP